MIAAPVTVVGVRLGGTTLVGAVRGTRPVTSRLAPGDTALTCRDCVTRVGAARVGDLVIAAVEHRAGCRRVTAPCA
jgi:hypothetical protein